TIQQGVHLLQVGGDGPGDTWFRYGTTVTEFATAHPFSLNKAPDDVTYAYPELPNAANNGVLLVSARLKDPSFVPADLYAGLFVVSEYAGLQSNPLGHLKVIKTVTQGDDLSIFTQPVVEKYRVSFAGMDFVKKKTIFISVMTREGMLLLYNGLVHT